MPKIPDSHHNTRFIHPLRSTHQDCLGGRVSARSKTRIRQNCLAELAALSPSERALRSRPRPRPPRPDRPPKLAEGMRIASCLVTV